MTLDEPIGTSAECRTALFDYRWVGTSVFRWRLDLPPSLPWACPVPSSSWSPPSLEQTELREGGERAGVALPCGSPSLPRTCCGRGHRPTEGFGTFRSADHVPPRLPVWGMGGEAGARQAQSLRCLGNHVGGERLLGGGPCVQAGNDPMERWNVGRPHNGALLRHEQEWVGWCPRARRTGTEADRHGERIDRHRLEGGRWR